MAPVAKAPAGQPRWLVSARYDVGFFILPGLISLIILFSSPRDLMESEAIPLWIWVALVVMIDVSHVYASLYRTYLDPEEFQRRRSLYLLVPGTLFLAGVSLYSVEALYFWRVLAYVAVIHFVRQQYGFLALYKYRRGERLQWEARFDKGLLYLTTAYPLIYWHTHLPRKFVWFVDGDFLSIPVRQVSLWSGYLYLVWAIAYLAKELWFGRRGRPLNPGKHLVLFTTAVNWYVGIVLFNSDFSFTVTNVVAHGVPYLALVWIYGRRKWRKWPGSWRVQTWFQPSRVGLFLGLLVGLAFLEEVLWDLIVWKEHLVLLGERLSFPSWGHEVLSLVVPLLALPQATHYVLDAFIWKLNGSNPDLKQLLFLDE
ncbi:MAG: hypothetical protein AB1898_17275 [Acidobacteriota bacterium]